MQGKKEGKIVSLSFTIFCKSIILLLLLDAGSLVNHQEFQSVVMEQRQTQQLLQEASASLKRFYVKEAHSWWWDDGCTWVKGSEVKLRVSRCHHLWATIVGGGFYFFLFSTTGDMIKFEKQIFQIWVGWWTNHRARLPSELLLPCYLPSHGSIIFQLWKAPAFIQAKKSKAGEPEFKDSVYGCGTCVFWQSW